MMLPVGLHCDRLPTLLVPEVEVGERQGRGGGNEQKEHEPALQPWVRLRFERIRWLENAGSDGFADSQVRTVVQVACQGHLNLFGRYLLRHHLSHQESRNLFTVVVGKLKTQHHRLFGGWNTQGYKPEALLARFKARRLHVSFDHGDWRLLLDLEPGSFPISQLRIHQTVERLGVTGPREYVHARCCDLVGVRTVISDSVTDQQTAIAFIKIPDRDFD